MSNVGELRKQAGLTQRQLADLVDVTESTIRNWESNRNSVEVFERIARLCKALGCGVEDLIRYEQVGGDDSDLSLNKSEEA